MSALIIERTPNHFGGWLVQIGDRFVDGLDFGEMLGFVARFGLTNIDVERESFGGLRTYEMCKLVHPYHFVPDHEIAGLLTHAKQTSQETRPALLHASVAGTDPASSPV